MKIRVNGYTARLKSRLIPSIIMVVALGLGTNIQAEVQSGFTNTQLTFKDGSGWEEVTQNICAGETVTLRAKGLTIASNGIILDFTIGTVREFIETAFVGMILPFAGPDLPEGWLPCDGRTITVDGATGCTFQLLANRVRDTWGGGGSVVDGNWTGTIQLPDLRGFFLRGANTGVNNQSQAMSSTRENPADTTNYRRYSDAARTVTDTSIQNLGTYQFSGYTSHSSVATASITSTLTTSTDSETHIHSGGTRASDGVGGTYRFFNANFFSGSYDATSGQGTAYISTQEGGYSNTSSSAEDSHTHTVSSTEGYSLNLQNTGIQESYPNNAAVIYAIRY